MKEIAKKKVNMAKKMSVFSEVKSAADVKKLHGGRTDRTRYIAK